MGGFNKIGAATAAAVSRHETGNYTSQAFIEKNNLFGITVGGKSLKTYKDRDESILDALKWFLNNGVPLEPIGPYWVVNAMKNAGYFTDKFEIYEKSVASLFATVKRNLKNVNAYV